MRLKNFPAMILFALSLTTSSASAQSAPVVVTEVPAMTALELIESIQGKCQNPPNCAEFRRRGAVKRLAREFPELFLPLAEDTYKDEKSLAETVAVAYWEHRVSTLPPEDQEEMLWRIFSGTAQGLIPATDYLWTKTFASMKLCEYGSHDRFGDLRAHLTSTWTKVSTVTREVSHCKDRYEAMQQFPTTYQAALAMLEGTVPAEVVKTQYWALEQVGTDLGSRLPEDRARVEAALVKAILRWQEEDIWHTGYSHAYRMLQREFKWRRPEFENAGIFKQPAVE